MKKITFLTALCLSFLWTHAAVIVDETFNYAATNLASEATWTTAGTLTTGTGRNIVSPALTYTNGGGTYILSGQGKTINVDINNASAYLTTKLLPSTINSGIIYLSYLFKAGTIQTQTSVEIFGLGTGTSAGPRVWVGKTATSGNWKFGITRSSTTSADVQWNTTEFNNVDEVVLLVIKHDFSTNNSSFYINPTLGGTEPASPAAFDNLKGTARTSLNVMWFRSNGTSMFKYNVGGARLSTTWAEAVQATSVAPPLTAPTVGTASGVAAESFTANWSAVANATGYTVKVYQGTTLVATGNASGQATESLFIKGLLTNTAYTYKVTAKGNGTDNADSEESAASALFTTAEGLTSISTSFNDGTWGTLYTIENQPLAGAFPSSYQNGFDLQNTFLYDISKYDSRGENNIYGLRMDRLSNGGAVTLPTVKSMEQIEIKAVPGGAPRSINLKEYVSGAWSTIGTYEMTSSTEIKEFIIPLSRAVPTKLKIENAGTGQVTLYHIAIRTTNPALLTPPVVGSASGISATAFTANWSAVANATGYKVRVYLGVDLVKTVEISGQSTESTLIDGLTPETTYTYKVFATGDGFNTYADSYLSDASASFATSSTTSTTSSNQKNTIITSGNTIISNIPGTIELYSLQGNLLQKTEIQHKLKTELKNGIYLLRFTSSDNQHITTKISIQ